jgi:hypothetical protein
VLWPRIEIRWYDRGYKQSVVIKTERSRGRFLGAGKIMVTNREVKSCQVPTLRALGKPRSYHRGCNIVALYQSKDRL